MYCKGSYSPYNTKYASAIFWACVPLVHTRVRPTMTNVFSHTSRFTPLVDRNQNMQISFKTNSVAPEEPIDQGTYRLLVWGLSLTLLAVVLIRSYSFGFGRHPSKDDPPPLWRIKVAWWTALSVSCFVPQLIGLLVMRYRPQPLSFLVSMGLTMFAIILFETYASNKTAELIMGFHNVGDNNERVHNELTYLASFRSAHQPDEECFLKVHTPKTEQDVE